MEDNRKSTTHPDYRSTGCTVYSAKEGDSRDKKDRHPVPDFDDSAYDYLKASSVTDCTGAVPRPPQTSAELDSYLDVYNFLPQCAYTQPNSVEIDMLANKGQAKKDPV